MANTVSLTRPSNDSAVVYIYICRNTLAFVFLEKVLGTIAHFVDGVHPALAVTRVLVVALEVRRLVDGRRVVHEALVVQPAETPQRIVRLHLRHGYRDSVDVIAFSVDLVADRHVRERFGRVHHHLYAENGVHFNVFLSFTHNICRNAPRRRLHLRWIPVHVCRWENTRRSYGSWSPWARSLSPRRCS